MKPSQPDPLDLIRDANPVPDQEALPGPAAAEAQAMLVGILNTEVAQVPRLEGIRARRRTLLFAALFFVLTGAGAAVAAGLFSPDPEDVAAVIQEESAGTEVHLPGWRPELSTEAVWCMYSSSDGAWTSASWFPLDEVMALEDLMNECVGGNDVARRQTSPPEAITVCSGTLAEDAYGERFGSTGESIVAGSIEDSYHGFPVILAWKGDCAATALETSWPVVLAPLTSLDDVNWARQIEIQVASESARRCLSESEADQLAMDAVRQLGDGWLLTERPDLLAECFQVILETEWGIVTVRGDDTPPLPSNPFP